LAGTSSDHLLSPYLTHSSTPKSLPENVLQPTSKTIDLTSSLPAMAYLPSMAYDGTIRTVVDPEAAVDLEPPDSSNNNSGPLIKALKEAWIWHCLNNYRKGCYKKGFPAHFDLNEVWAELERAQKKTDLIEHPLYRNTRTGIDDFET